MRARAAGDGRGRGLCVGADATYLRRPLAELPDPLPIPTLTSVRGGHPFHIALRPPGSKSLTNRALLLAALAAGESMIRRPLVEADDAQRMIAALRVLGAAVEPGANGLRVRGVGGRWRTPAEGARLDLNNAGTATRFLAAAAALAPAPVTIDGNARMRERPIGELIGSLTHLGVRAEYLGREGYPPVRLVPREGGSSAAAAITLPTTLSSQFISALLLVGPWMPGGLTLRLEGEITSRSYVAMTVGLLGRLGARVEASEDLRTVRVAAAEGGWGVPPFEYEVEPDASGAAYFWAAAALCPGAVCRVEGLGPGSLQGDAGFPSVLSSMGAGPAEAGDGIACLGPATLAPVETDMRDMPDAAMTLAVVASFAEGVSVVRGLRTLRVKETDRIAALQNELAKIGVRVRTDVPGDPDAVTITPPRGGVDCSPGAPRVEFDTYDDHRMAMSLALVGLRRPNVWIRDPGCVAKTYPGFWGDLAGLY